MNHKSTKKLSAKITADQNSKPKQPAYMMGVDTAAKHTKDKAAMSVFIKDESGNYRNVGTVVDKATYKKKVVEAKSEYQRPSSAPSFNHF